MTTEGCEALEALGRTRLSRNFFMRDFLYSETASEYGVRNFPDHPGVAIAAASQLCTEILEPLQETFGRVHVRSAFRSERVNQICVDRGLNCAPNDQARGNHIWDSPDQRGARGAMACVVLPWLIDQCDAGMDWREFAWWVHDHLPFSKLILYRELYAFNIAWSEAPLRLIYSRIEPVGVLAAPVTASQWIGEAHYADLLARLKSSPNPRQSSSTSGAAP